jgi:dihydroorotate dehydrogenase (NAD+) catalytic subunit
MSSRLTVEIAGLRLSNPTMLAAGILGLSAATLEEAVRQGAGAVVTKSVSLKPRLGYANPAVVQIDNCGLLNAIGLPNPGARYFADEIKELKKGGINAPIIASVFGFSADEFAEAAKILAKTGADAVELNVSCPHVKKTGSEIGQTPDIVSQVVKQVKSATAKPVIVKLTPNLADIVEVALAAVEARADALAAINTVRAMAKQDRRIVWTSCQANCCAMCLRNLRSGQCAYHWLRRNSHLAGRRGIYAGRGFCCPNRHRHSV